MRVSGSIGGAERREVTREDDVWHTVHGVDRESFLLRGTRLGHPQCETSGQCSTTEKREVVLGMHRAGVSRKAGMSNKGTKRLQEEREEERANGKDGHISP
jgi:hypothetical protein